MLLNTIHVTNFKSDIFEHGDIWKLLPGLPGSLVYLASLGRWARFKLLEAATPTHEACTGG